MNRLAKKKFVLTLTAYPAGPGPWDRWEITRDATGEIILEGGFPMDENAVRTACDKYWAKMQSEHPPRCWETTKRGDWEDCLHCDGGGFCREPTVDREKPGVDVAMSRIFNNVMGELSAIFSLRQWPPDLQAGALRRIAAMASQVADGLDRSHV